MRSSMSARLAAPLLALLLALPGVSTAQEATFSEMPPAELAPLDSAAVPAEPTSIEAELRQRAEAQFALGDVPAALATHALLEDALTGSERSAARDALWRALNALPVSSDFSGVTDRVARGWVELMQLAKSGAPLQAYEDWHQRHPDHPGESQIAAGLVTVSSLSPARRIALLLPLAGPLAGASKAIQAGAEAARSRGAGDAPPIVVIDTSTGLEAAVSASVSGGAMALVGPLRKEDVAAFAARPPAVPAITLNYLDPGRVPPAGLTPFGLAPEDEARAAAEHAAGRGLQRAVIYAQEGDWGSRAAAAFQSQFELRGGTVLASDTFRVKTVDFTAALKRLLGITYTDPRPAALATPGVKVELQPTPRSDIDVVYIAARSAQAKLIWPQMRYLRAGRIASYAPAAAADAGSRDLGGMQVCDAPWRIETQGSIAALRGELAAQNPRTADAQRLFALGYDAYDLARRAAVSALVPGELLPGLTGVLALESDGAVHRRLDCVALIAPRVDGLPVEVAP